MPDPLRLAVLASGGGSNLQALIDHFHPASRPAARVELVVASRAGTGAEERARRAGVDALVLSSRELGAEQFTAALLTQMERRAIDVVVLAGYLQQVPLAVVESFRGRMINIHPALLPAFGGPGMYGARVHRAVIESGARVTGATVHLVDEHYDSGRVLAQWPVPVLPGDSPESLAARVLRVEHLLLPAAVEMLARGGGGSAPADPVAFELVSTAAPAGESIQMLTSGCRVARAADSR